MCHVWIGNIILLRMRFRQLVVQVLRVNLQQTQSKGKQRKKWICCFFMFLVWFYAHQRVETECWYPRWWTTRLVVSEDEFQVKRWQKWLWLRPRCWLCCDACGAWPAAATLASRWQTAWVLEKDSGSRFRSTNSVVESLCLPLTLGTKAGRTISWIENLHINWLSRSLLFASQEKNVLFACKKKLKNDTNCFVILQFYIRKICSKGFNASILLHLCALKLLALGWRCGAFLGQGWQRSKDRFDNYDTALEHLYRRVDVPYIETSKT